MKDEDLEIIQVIKGASKNDDENDQVDKFVYLCGRINHIQFNSLIINSMKFLEFQNNTFPLKSFQAKIAIILVKFYYALNWIHSIQPEIWVQTTETSVHLTTFK